MAVTEQSAGLVKRGLTTGGAALQAVGGALLPIPGLGWIIGGALALVGSGLQIAAGTVDPERAASREWMLSQGTSATFASKYAFAQGWSDAKIQKELDQEVRSYQARPTMKRLEKIAALRYVINQRTAQVVTQQATMLEQAALAEYERTRTQRRMYAVGGGISAVLAMAILYLRSQRRR